MATFFYSISHHTKKAFWLFCWAIGVMILLLLNNDKSTNKHDFTSFHSITILTAPAGFIFYLTNSPLCAPLSHCHCCRQCLSPVPFLSPVVTHSSTSIRSPYSAFVTFFLSCPRHHVKLFPLLKSILQKPFPNLVRKEPF